MSGGFAIDGTKSKPIGCKKCGYRKFIKVVISTRISANAGI